MNSCQQSKTCNPDIRLTERTKLLYAV